MQPVDAVIIGAGAAGLHCAAIAGQRGLKVLLIDHAERVAEKIRISGGGRCNFTNRDTTPAQFLSANPAFCRSALARYTPQDFIGLLQRHRIPFHEKHKGQLFCDQSSEDIIAMLLRECETGAVTRWQPCAVHTVVHDANGFEISTDRGTVRSARLIVATGGLSIPKIGATDFGHRLARQFGHKVVETRPALVPLTFDANTWQPFVSLAGLSLEAVVSTGSTKGRDASGGRFTEDLLFTHRGLSGPAVLQISSYWRPGTPLTLDLVPQHDLQHALTAAKATSRRKLSNELAEWLPRRLADTWLQTQPEIVDRPLPDLRDRDLAALATSLKQWRLVPNGTEGYRKAEVTAGGVDTRELSSTTLESKRVAGLHFIGEVVDVTGWLGGYNFQWAWASAAACAGALSAPSDPPTA
ncbi:MAG: aminoacetone oxidase family FAD-binding enzyme [Burkholderiales bacterium PBB1]|nr:MAG: aminoacetone oxidase family FAD-binding enzyme [Burkholderiales bacterium PBB1]